MTSTSPTDTAHSVPPLDNALALILPWSNQNSANALSQLLQAGYRVHSAGKPFQMTATGLAVKAGDLIIHLHQLNTDQRRDLSRTLQAIQKTGPLPMTVINKGYAATGVDLGSGSHKLIELPRPLLWTGTGVNAYAAGEVWHLLDNAIGISPVRVNTEKLKKIKLDDYSHLLMVDGSYPQDDALKEKIADWVKSGGVLVSARRAANWAGELFEQVEPESENSEDTAIEQDKFRSYADYDADQAEQIVGGAIVETRLDLSHPLSFGYQRQRLPMMRNGTTLLKAPSTPYSTVAVFSKNPLIAGFMGPEQQQAISDQPAVIADRQGEGLIIRFANNPNFRGYFKGSMRLYINSLFLSGMVDNTKI